MFKRITDWIRKKVPESFFDWAKFLLVLSVVAALWWAGWWLIDNRVDFGKDVEDINAARGQFGDKFGAINALFAGFAFAGIIFTILLQSRELKQTKAMLEDQMKESKGERFDGTFFQLIGLHNDLTAKLESLSLSGRRAFEAFNERLRQSDQDFLAFLAFRKLSAEEVMALSDAAAGGEPSTRELRIALELDRFAGRLLSKDRANIASQLKDGASTCQKYLREDPAYHEDKIKVAYSLVAEYQIDEFAHYFRNLYHILRFISESDLISDSEKQRYAKILRSQLSEVELWALFYNSITQIKIKGRDNLELGCPKMGRLLQKFDMLQNLGEKNLIHPSHWAIYLKNNGGNQ
jgi:hypothetical protein